MKRLLDQSIQQDVVPKFFTEIVNQSKFFMNWNQRILWYVFSLFPSCAIRNLSSLIKMPFTPNLNSAWNYRISMLSDKVANMRREFAFLITCGDYQLELMPYETSVVVIKNVTAFKKQKCFDWTKEYDPQQNDPETQWTPLLILVRFL